ncbi:acyl-CoA dehydrogenase family protein [Bradyrhizobium genosp. P]|uniref:acyl-CoA dehydrogenase family protein n=1 Tax=Bradyrhizobium genosp. P TaxID=83641 RepID=UPI003CF07D8F
MTTNVQLAHRGADAPVKQQPIGHEAARLLAAIEDLAPELAARAGEIESVRRIPADITDRLGRMGLFRTLVPRSHGGLELSVPEVLPLIEALSAADGSVGWVAMIGTASQVFRTRVSRATFDKIVMGRADALTVGVGTPAGRGEAIDGGYRVSGRWPFASGCQNAQWIAGCFVIHKDGAPVMSDGRPLTGFIVLPAECWRIEETWQASGLTGSGSHHVVLDNVTVAEAETFDLFHGSSCLPGPFASAITPFIGSLHAAVATGIATGAVADLVAMAGSGRRQLFATADLRDSPVFQHELGRLGAALRAARALMLVQAESDWRRALAGALDGKADFVQSLQGSAWIHATCSDVVSGCYTLGGSSVVLNASPLQRRLRDIHVARQHAFAQERFYARAGANALGFPPVDPISGQ